MTDQPTTRNPFALLSAYVTAALFPDRADKPERKKRKPGQRRAGGRRRRGETPTPTYRRELGAGTPVVVPKPASPPGDATHTRED